MKTLFLIPLLLLTISLEAAPPPPNYIGPESDFTHTLKPLTNAPAWRAALGITNGASGATNVSFNNITVTTNLFVTNIIGGSLTINTNVTIGDSIYVTNGGSIFINGNQVGPAMWTNAAGVYQPTELQSQLEATNIISAQVLTAEGAFKIPFSLQPALELGTNDLDLTQVGAVRVVGPSTNATDAYIRLNDGSGEGSILFIENFSDNSAFTLRNGEPLTDDPSKFVRLNGDWAPTVRGDTLLLRNDGVVWTEITRVSGSTNAPPAFTINPTDGYLPYRENATTFGDSPIYRIDTNTAAVDEILAFTVGVTNLTTGLIGSVLEPLGQFGYLTNIANGTGALTNDGAGNLGFTELLSASAINPTDGFMPFRSSETTFDDSPLMTTNGIVYMTDGALTNVGYITPAGALDFGKSVDAWWSPTADDGVVTIHDQAQGESAVNLTYVGAVDDSLSVTNVTEAQITTSADVGAGRYGQINIGALSDGVASRFTVNIQPEFGISNLELTSADVRNFYVDDVTGYSGAGTQVFMDNGRFGPMPISDGTNTTVVQLGPFTPGFIPYATGTNTLGDSPLYRINTNTLGFNLTNKFLFGTTGELSIGYETPQSPASSGNTFAGALAGQNSGGTFNTGFGNSANRAQTGTQNTAVGRWALRGQVSGLGNTAVGYNTMVTGEGAYNTAMGAFALDAGTTISNNVAIGAQAATSLLTGKDTTFIGTAAGLYITNSFDSVIVGFNQGVGQWPVNLHQSTIIGAAGTRTNTVQTLTNVITVGYDVLATNDNVIVIGNSNNTASYLPLSLSLGEGGSGTSKIIFGPGTTNVLYKSGSDLVYTNGAAAPVFKVANGSAATMSVGLNSSGNGFLLASSRSIVVDQGTSGSTLFDNSSGTGSPTTYVGPGVVNLQRQSIGTVVPVQTYGFLAQNLTAATASAQQNSPSVTWTGTGWGTNSATSQSVIFGSYVIPRPGADTPTGRWVMSTVISNTAPSTVFEIDSQGPIVLKGITKAQKTAIASPSNGMLVYQTDNTPGLRAYVNGAWVMLSTVADP